MFLPCCVPVLLSLFRTVPCFRGRRAWRRDLPFHPMERGRREGSGVRLAPRRVLWRALAHGRAGWQPEQPPSASAEGRSRGRRASVFQGAPSEAGLGGRDPEPGQASSWVGAEALELGRETMEGWHLGLKSLKQFVLCRVLCVHCSPSGSGPTPDGQKSSCVRGKPLHEYLCPSLKEERRPCHQSARNTD